MGAVEAVGAARAAGVWVCTRAFTLQLRVELQLKTAEEAVEAGAVGGLGMHWSL